MYNYGHTHQYEMQYYITHSNFWGSLDYAYVAPGTIEIFNPYDGETIQTVEF